MIKSCMQTLKSEGKTASGGESAHGRGGDSLKAGCSWHVCRAAKALAEFCFSSRKSAMFSGLKTTGQILRYLMSLENKRESQKRVVRRD